MKKFKPSATKTVIRSKVEALTPKSRYRQFKLTPLADGRPRFRSISIGGISLLMDGISEDMYFADVEEVKRAVKAPAPVPVHAPVEALVNA